MWYPFKNKIEAKVTQKIIGSLVRHALTAVGGAGLITGDQTEQVISAISLIASIVWSVIQKKNQEKASDAK